MTGKFTSGGALIIGWRFITGLARTPNHVTLCSVEAELVALVKCTAELLGVQSMLRDFGVEKAGVVYAGSSAALPLVKRNGADELWHIHINCLWIPNSWSIARFLAPGTHHTL